MYIRDIHGYKRLLTIMVKSLLTECKLFLLIEVTGLSR